MVTLPFDINIYMYSSCVLLLPNQTFFIRVNKSETERQCYSTDKQSLSDQENHTESLYCMRGSSEREGGRGGWERKLGFILKLQTLFYKDQPKPNN